MSGVAPDPPGPPPRPPAPAGFELLEPLGQGSSGVVWSALASVDGAVVALKWLPGAGPSVAALEAEADTLAALDHPNILRLLDLVAGPSGEPVLVLEHAAGGSLADALAERGALPHEEVARIGASLADALHAAHQGGVLHRDVKPSNVVFTADGAPLLADFGVAAARGRGRTGGDVVGTAEYLDPAVAAGADPGPRSDVYALGITLYEALAGHVPFTGATPAAVVAAADDGRHITLDLAAPGTPDHVVAAVERSIARDPRDRPRRALDLAVALRDGPGGAPVTTGLPWDPPSRRPAPVTAPAGPPDPLVPLGRTPAPAPAPTPLRPTRDFGPRPPRPGPAAVLRRAAVLAPLAALLVTGAVLVSPLSPLAGDDEPRKAAAPPLASAPCPTVERGPGFVAADLDGDGCPTALRWDGEVLEVPEGTTVAAARYAIGRPGDVLLFGDWDCDGLVTPAIHRADVGQTVVFDDWAEPGRPLEGRTGAVAPGGEATVRSGDDGCDRLVVTPE